MVRDGDLRDPALDGGRGIDVDGRGRVGRLVGVEVGRSRGSRSLTE
jgi:hypothetical protein